ncbi:ATPase, FliI/YscN family [Leptospira inadai serovar Lyme str. 10]|uniref:ATPase, FliI/YscN family n=2 Tax=Leptospira inadai serovar Lyme TaxID=293084 RepID=V6HIK3_9LEPT|nr:FliI/YscN family ATPase [Leptospira inadai]EQA36525.1 ATPase, FliI/YscN family [Leptospira inadai serovar Lyme str. 10]PNV75727.1 flagellum-specific ATP synthase FliI [Leptospira inadai serovar Lyme]
MIEKKFYEKVDVISKYFLILDRTETIRKSGRVVRVAGNVIYSEGPPDSKIGEIMDVEKAGIEGYLQCEIVGFENHVYTLMPLGPVEGVYPDAFVFSSGRRLTVPVGKELLGRVLNGVGKPIDKKGLIITSDEKSPEGESINPLDRPIIRDILLTGVRAIDGILTVGRGQRLGIFSGSGVGKSSLLGMISRFTDADVNIIALVGERGREVNEFIERDLGKEGLARSVVFAATSDSPKMEQVNCALLATSVAEYFREQGLHVNLMMDSLTRFAHANREISVSNHEPPITRGFSSSVFSKLARLVERSGTSKAGGSITGFYTILTDTDEMEDPVADAVRGYIDGHIVLSRKIAERNHYPAIDIPGSLSRVMQSITDEDHFMRAGMIRELVSMYNSVEELILLNAYVRGSDAKVDLAIRKKEKIDTFLRQKLFEKSPFPQTLSALRDILREEREEEEF